MTAVVSVYFINNRIGECFFNLRFALTNHPGGSSKASDADLNFSVSIDKLLQSVDINFIDHIIIGNDEPFSLRMSFMKDEW